MADKLTVDKRSWNMSRIKSKNTIPEISVRKELFKRGLRYRIKSTLPGKPDIVLSSRKTVIFIHGCFWHQHGCKDTYRPKTKKRFWNTKLDRNIERDKEVKSKLLSQGWTVIIIWECEIKDKTYLNKILFLENRKELT